MRQFDPFATATYLLGLGLFRRLLGLPATWLPPAAALAVLAGAALGLALNGAAEVAGITVVLVLAIVLDTRRTPAVTVIRD